VQHRTTPGLEASVSVGDDHLGAGDPGDDHHGLGHDSAVDPGVAVDGVRNTYGKAVPAR
jgi:hypothetical protein